MKWWSAVIVESDSGKVIDSYSFTDKPTAAHFIRECEKFKMEHQEWHLIKGLQLVLGELGDVA